MTRSESSKIVPVWYVVCWASTLVMATATAPLDLAVFDTSAPEVREGRQPLSLRPRQPRACELRWSPLITFELFSIAIDITSLECVLAPIMYLCFNAPHMTQLTRPHNVAHRGLVRSSSQTQLQLPNAPRLITSERDCELCGLARRLCLRPW